MRDERRANVSVSGDAQRRRVASVAHRDTRDPDRFALEVLTQESNWGCSTAQNGIPRTPQPKACRSASDPAFVRIDHLKWFSPEIGRRRLREIDEATIDRLFGRMRKAGLSASR